MPSRRRIGTLATAVVGGCCLTLGLSCSWGGAGRSAAGAPATSAQKKDLIEIYSWWTAPGEAEALQSLVATHKAAYPTTRFFNAAAASGSKARESLALRLDRHDPPDLFQANVHDLQADLARAPGRVVWLDDIFTRAGLDKRIYPEVVRDVTTDGGHVFALPVDLHRENALFYNKQIFAALKLPPPRTFPEFLETCKILKREGITPLATADQGWILRIFFNSVAMGRLGADTYRAVFAEQRPVDPTALADVLSTFDRLLREDVNPDWREEGFGWTNAAQALYNGDAAMFMHGDWAKGYLQQLGWRPGVDFGVVGAPGAAELFLYGVDVFALPSGAVNEAGARDFLSTVASSEGQVAFNRLKGSSPVRMDAPREALDPVGQETLDDLRRARYRLLVHSNSRWEDALVALARDHQIAAAIRAFHDSPPFAQ